MNRKISQGLMLPLSFLLLICAAGCEFDAPTPAYYQDQTAAPAPRITGMNPSNTAQAGANTITIQGENFSTVAGSNRVYFGSFEAELVSQSATALVVRRPNINGETSVNITTAEAMDIAKLAKYTIAPVVAPAYGFVENKQLITFLLDKNNNLYAFMFDTPDVLKVTPAGVKTTVGTLKRTITDAILAKDGQLVTFANNQTITKMDPATGTETDWTRLTKRVSFGDFDQNGNLYAGGNNSDIIVVNPDLTKTASGVQTSSNIKDVRVFNNYVYVCAERATEPMVAIWKHEIKSAAGALGEKQLVLDMATTGAYAQSVVKDFTFSKDGIMYIATDNANPVMMLYPDQRQDVLYKKIIPTTAERLIWGNDNFIFMLQAGSKRDILAIDVGAPGAVYYSR